MGPRRSTGAEERTASIGSFAVIEGAKTLTKIEDDTRLSAPLASKTRAVLGRCGAAQGRPHAGAEIGRVA